MESFDTIIVGAGSAGSVLAGRLGEDPGHKILVLEAGGSDLNVWIQMPIGYGKTFYDGRVNWKYTTEPDPGTGGRRSYWPRGKVMGGSSSINAMVYVRGHRIDFDDWQAAGAAGWGWHDVEPYFRRMEDWSGPADPARGKGGPLAVCDIGSQIHPLCAAYFEAAGQYGIEVIDDYNARQMEGAAVYQITTKGGRRASTSRCYLRPALRRGNVRLETYAQATGLILDGNQVTGVAWRQDGVRHQAHARRQVILSAGAVNSPQLLQLSGIGPPELLRRHGIEVRHALPAVGAHLQDHLGTDFHFRATRPTLNQELRPWLGRLRVGLRYLLRQDGPLSLSVNQVGGFVRSRPELATPDLQLYFSPVSYTRVPPGTRQLMHPDPFPGFLLGFDACRPTSRGEIAIRSADPFEAPSIRPNYLATEHDRRQAVDGMRYLRGLSETPAMRQVIDSEISPGKDVTGDQAYADYFRDHAWTVYHPCCTCRMGRDATDSVTDSRLRVHGIDGLRVVDASAFPNITAGNINAPTIMLAEKAADLIREDARR